MHGTRLKYPGLALTPCSWHRQHADNPNFLKHFGIPNDFNKQYVIHIQQRTLDDCFLTAFARSFRQSLVRCAKASQELGCRGLVIECKNEGLAGRAVFAHHCAIEIDCNCACIRMFSTAAQSLEVELTAPCVAPVQILFRGRRAQAQHDGGVHPERIEQARGEGDGWKRILLSSFTGHGYPNFPGRHVGVFNALSNRNLCQHSNSIHHMQLNSRLFFAPSSVVQKSRKVMIASQLSEQPAELETPAIQCPAVQSEASEHGSSGPRSTVPCPECEPVLQFSSNTRPSIPGGRVRRIRSPGGGGEARLSSTTEASSSSLSDQCTTVGLRAVSAARESGESTQAASTEPKSDSGQWGPSPCDGMANFSEPESRHTGKFSTLTCRNRTPGGLGPGSQ
eukprot:756755-Hanusia_phi.AAC.1